MMKLYLFFLIISVILSPTRGDKLVCRRTHADTTSNRSNCTLKVEIFKGIPGNNGSKETKGKMGIKGEKGDRGSKGDNGDKGDKGEKGEERIIKQKIPVTLFPTNCSDVKKDNPNATNGLYYLSNTAYNTKYLTYCDMSVDGGVETLVATVHENNIKENGRCSPGDKWSSESGNLQGSQQGAEAWSNRVTFGQVISATSDDYKNEGYFDLTAKNIMIWQVMDDTPLSEYYSNAYLRYYTTDDFLTKYGGNLFQLYKIYFPIKSGVYEAVKGNGPAVPITYDKGNNLELLSHYGELMQGRIDPGYIEFRAINKEKSAYALCPGTKGKSINVNLEHRCIGSTSDNNDKRYCGDFAGFVWDQYGTGVRANTDMTLLKTTFMIFYR